MITEERMMTLLAKANPEPFEDLEFESTAASYLATLNQRSSDTAETEKKKSRTSPMRQRRTPVLVAAALALLVGLGVVLATQRGGEAPVATDPTPTTTAVETATTIGTDSRLAETPTWLGSPGAGTYRPSLFGFPFAFTVADEGWETGVDSRTEFAICGPDVDGPVGARSACFRASAVAVFLLDRGTVAETQMYLSTAPGADVTNVAAVSIDGAEGIRFSLNHSLIPNSNPEGGFDGYPYWLHETQEIPLGADMAIVSIVDVNGTVVTIVYQGRAITDPTAFEANLAEGMAIVDSIIWDQ